MDLIKETDNYLKEYRVADVINKDMDYLFILESPHIAEIKEGYPVAGNSGVEMTKFIYDEDSEDAFGKLVNNKDDYKNKYHGLNKSSIMNVVPAPMQASALKEYDLSSTEEKIVALLEKLRVNYAAKKHRNPDWNQLKKVLIDNFAHRLDDILTQYRPNYLIPCGKLAQTYLEIAITSKEINFSAEIIDGIPHPSRNQWRQYDSMSKLENLLSEEVYSK